MKKPWNQYVREKMQAQNLRQDDIAETMGKTQGAIGHWLTGRRMPNVNEVAQMINLTGVNKVILNGDGTIEDFDPNITPTSVKKSRAYPLVSSIQAGMWTETYDFRDSEGYDYIDTEIDAGPNAFFLRVSGMSMEPKFSEGDLVLIDVRKRPHPGDFVAAVNGNGEATLKRYRELGELSPSGNPHFELVPLNQDFPTLSSMKQDIRIIGVAVEHRSYL
ncbi:LexA family protein [Glaesserella parasuis]|uniref:LexA family protein n=1 Tax=Glaesserella parasuis TaxID=738 RepID=UPI00243717C1|nr:LexA family transcriptional regulator [Glaesserella parasuis]MDG6274928.1 LexA family transcriptional regulator [Glaesserella parasuis]MDG6279114.1 LexA family transcriptional regulator [Glaesserella parasuis]MDG6299990.1 LexA family transcriptional regulator [Glaesserella parasuis]MDG6321633.1 LexA family transcriptional regulator [Glaesserella parasuis]